jgi:hypothetical protein
MVGANANIFGNAKYHILRGRLLQPRFPGSFIGQYLHTFTQFGLKSPDPCKVQHIVLAVEFEMFHIAVLIEYDENRCKL